MPELIRIGEIWLNPSQIQYFRLFDRGETLILYFAGRSLTFSGKEMESVLKLIRRSQHHPSTSTAPTELCTPPTMRRRA